MKVIVVKNFLTKFFQYFLKNKIKIYSRKSSYGAVFAEIFYRSIIDLIKRPVFERGDGNWIDVLPKKTNQ